MEWSYTLPFQVLLDLYIVMKNMISVENTLETCIVREYVWGNNNY